MSFKTILRAAATVLLFSSAQSFARSSAGQRSLSRVTDLGRNSSYTQEMSQKSKNQMAEENNKTNKSAKKRKITPDDSPQTARKNINTRSKPLNR